MERGGVKNDGSETSSSAKEAVDCSIFLMRISNCGGWLLEERIVGRLLLVKISC